MAEEKRRFPTEVVDLPSKGLLYPKDSPLAGGTIELKYMTAKEEDILTSRNLIQKGVVLDKLLESVIIDDNVSLDDLLLGDKNAIMIATRVLGYGKDYSVQLTDPSTGDKQKETFDLTLIKDKEINTKLFKGGKNEFDFELPASKTKITFRLLTHKEEKEIEAELKALKKFQKDSGITSEITTRLKKAVLSVNGDNSTKRIVEFVDNELLSRDSLALREHLTEITPDVDMSFTFTSDTTGEDTTMDIPLDVEFFWPAGRR
jgi:hypothetical protein|tara:strand:- start:2039 stop:2818 length:780 start_codon:yes stop_codon:yes gene_type:complete